MKITPDPIEMEGFIWRYLSSYLTYPIEDFHKELMRQIRHQRVAIAAPRSFAKSTYFSLFYPLYLTLMFPKTQVLLVSATGALAEWWLAKIRRELESNPKLIQTFGSQEGKGKWAIDEIHMENGSIIMAKGAGKQIRGFRPDVVIGDDLETDEMVVSTDQRAKFDHWFWTDLLGTLRPECQMIVVGTILHPESFLALLIKQGREGWITKFYQAFKEEGVSLWPDAWSAVELDQRKKEMGEYLFAQEYMNDPIPDDMRKFQAKWFKYYDKPPPNAVYFTTIDPAIETTSSSDKTAIVTCAIDSDKNIYVVDVINKRMLPNETIDTIFNVFSIYKSASIGIESVGFQKMLKYQLEEERKRRGEWPVIVELKSGGRRKTLRIEALQPLFENGKIYHREDMQELETQLLRFPSTRCKDDIIDALAYQLDIIRPAKHEIVRVNPESFLATIERRRLNRYKKQGMWGHHVLEKYWR